jgi:hypothetical protein
MGPSCSSFTTHQFLFSINIFNGLEDFFILLIATSNQTSTIFGWFFLFPIYPVLARISGLASRAPPLKPDVSTLADASLFSVFSGGHASFLEITSFTGASLEAVSCGWQLL